MPCLPCTGFFGLLTLSILTMALTPPLSTEISILGCSSGGQLPLIGEDVKQGGFAAAALESGLIGHLRLYIFSPMTCKIEEISSDILAQAPLGSVLSLLLSSSCYDSCRHM